MPANAAGRTGVGACSGQKNADADAAQTQTQMQRRQGRATFSGVQVALWVRHRTETRHAHRLAPSLAQRFVGWGRRVCSYSTACASRRARPDAADRSCCVPSRHLEASLAGRGSSPPAAVPCGGGNSPKLRLCLMPQLPSRQAIRDKPPQPAAFIPGSTGRCSYREPPSSGPHSSTRPTRVASLLVVVRPAGFAHPRSQTVPPTHLVDGAAEGENRPTPPF